ALAYMHGTEKLLLSKLPFHKELFDLGADRTEHHSVYGQDAQRTASIAAMLSDHYNGLSRRRGRHQTVDVKDETRQSILALGYFAGGKSREEQSIPGSIRPADLDPEGDLGWA